MNLSRWTRPNAQPSLPALSEAPEPTESVASETPTSDEYGLLGCRRPMGRASPS